VFDDPPGFRDGGSPDVYSLASYGSYQQHFEESAKYALGEMYHTLEVRRPDGRRAFRRRSPRLFIGVFVPIRCHLGLDLPTSIFEDDLPPSILRRLELEYTFMDRDEVAVGAAVEAQTESGVPTLVPSGMEADRSLRMGRIDELEATNVQLVYGDTPVDTSAEPSYEHGLWMRLEVNEFPVYSAIASVKGTLYTTRLVYNPRRHQQCQIIWPLTD
jgi:hypothetical protein